MLDLGLTSSIAESNCSAAPASPTRQGEPRREASSNLAPVSLADLAADVGVQVPNDPQLAKVTFPVRRVRAGELLYRAGDRCDAIYVVRAGFFKTVRVQSNGIEQVMAFPMRGDPVGLDGVDSGNYHTDAIALDTSVVVKIAPDQLTDLASARPVLERLLHFLYSREIRLQQQLMLILGSLAADARVATFLLHQADKFGRLGYSRTALMLRMSRQEIGSYLGIKLETVSRCLSSLAAAGLVNVHQRSIVLRDVDALRDVAAPPASVPRSLRPAIAAKRAWSRYDALNSSAAFAAAA